MAFFLLCFSHVYRSMLLAGLLFLLTWSIARATPYRIVTTTGMIADITQVVAGDQAQVEGLIGEGVDPHLYKPTRTDVVYLQKADVVFYNGLMLEGKMGDMLARLSRRGKLVVPVTEKVVERPDYILYTAEAHYDPHVWMDVSGWLLAVDVITDSLVRYDPAHAELYVRRSKSYKTTLEQLHTYAKTVLGSIPPSQRVLVTAHDAFNYFGRAYGIEVRGIQGISTESEAGVRDIERLITFLIERNVKAVFVETSVADKNVRALVEGAKAKGHKLVVGGSLYSDAMGGAGTYDGTYIGMLDHNITTVGKALGATYVPKGGFRAFQQSRVSREKQDGD